MPARGVALLPALLLAAAVTRPAAAQGPPAPAPAQPPAQPPVEPPAGAAADVALVLGVQLPPPVPLRIARLVPAGPPRHRPAVRAPRVDGPIPRPREVRVWKRILELSGNVFVGNRPQTVLTSRGRASHADSTFEFGADVRFTYGMTTQDGVREVSQRLWFGSANLDLWPFAANSPFVLGTVESSLERRIDLRVSGGVGHKFTFRDDERTLANLSVALLGERSRLRTAADGVSSETLARFSTRARLRRRVGTRLELSHETFFRPEYANLQQFTLSNNAVVSYRMNETVNVRLSYLDNYDTEARDRGARSNYDGQLVAGVAAEF